MTTSALIAVQRLFRRLSMFFGVVLLALLATACSQQEEAAQAPSEPAAPVETVQVRREDLAVTVDAVGSLAAAEAVTVRPELADIVTAIHFREGQTVARGDLLFSLENDELRQQLAARRAALSAAKATAANAGRTLERQRILLKENVVPPETFEEAGTAYKTAASRVDRLEAEIRGIQARLDNTEIRSPLDGRAGAERVEVGDFVEVGQDLVTIVGTGTLEIDFTVPGRYANRVAVGQTVAVRTAADPEQAVEGTVFFVSPAIREDTRDLLLKARIDNAPGRLHPGAFATVTLTLAVREKALTLPEEALVPRRSGYSVFVVEDGRARRRDVTIGERRPGRVEIRQGLSAEDTVIRAGHMAVADGDRVRIVDGR
jgi:membrane fusion protein (multidrug efflux system)